MALSQNIRYLRLKQGWGQEVLADKLGFKSYTTIQKWESGVSEPRLATVHKLADLFQVDFDDLVNEDLDHSSVTSIRHKEMETYNPTHRIPILGTVAAGLPLYAEQNIEGYTYTELNHGGEYFALRVHGDSMTAARIYDGDTLIVRVQDTAENGQIAVVMVGDDEATVKRFYQTETTVTLMPQSLNPAHQPQIYDVTKTNIRVIGLVVENKITF